MSRVFERWTKLDELGIDCWLYVTEVRPQVFRWCLVNKRTNAILDVFA